jgi:hypothetical protein
MTGGIPGPFGSEDGHDQFVTIDAAKEGVAARNTLCLEANCLVSSLVPSNNVRFKRPRNRAACSVATRLLTHEDQALNALR